MNRQFRLKSDLYVVLGIWEASGIAISAWAFFPPHPNDFWPMQIIALLFCHVPCAVGVWWIHRTRIFADERGLCFRSPIRARFVAWDEIEDFGWELAPEGNKSEMWRATLWVAGKKRRLSRMLHDFDELREIIAARAVNAPAREWALVGTRDCDESPHTFIYRDTPNWKIGAWFFGIAALMALRMGAGAVGKGFEPIIATFTQMWEALEVGGRVGFVFVMAFSLFGLPTMMVTMMCLGLGAKRRFLEQHIVATREGLEWWNGPSRRVVRWEEIERFELEPMRGHLQLPLCVVFGRGQRFEFHSGIEQRRLLRALIVQKAVNSSTHEWEMRLGVDEDNLAGELSLWPSGVVGIGAKRHHYRTRTNRALLLFCWTPPVLFVVVPLLAGHREWRGWGDIVGNLLAMGCMVLAAGFGTLGFWRSWVETDAEGLRHHSLWSTRTMEWGQIRRVSFNGYFLQIKGEQGTMRVGNVTALEHLMSEIEARSGVKTELAPELRSGA